MRATALLCVPLALGAACQPREPTLTEADRSAVVDTVRRIVAGVFAAATRRDAAGYVSVYAADADVHPACGTAWPHQRSSASARQPTRSTGRSRPSKRARAARSAR